MTPLDFWLGFVLGVVGSLHCVQMCGPIVLAYSLPLGSVGRSRQVLAHLSYNTGRVATYTVLGALAGSAGGALGLLGDVAGAFNAAAVVAGALMLLAALQLAGIVARPGLLSRGVLRPGSWLSQAAGRFLRSPRPGAKLAMGAVLGLLPCGLLYAAVLKAVDTASAGAGAMTMFAFGLGTTGALVGTGLFSGTVARWLGRWAAWLPAVTVGLMGAFLLWRGLTGIAPGAVGHHGQ